MSQTYKTTAINLKAIPLGETDRLLTLLSPDVGLVRVVAPGSRKHQSRLGGRSDLFVVNDCLIVKGKQLDKLVQAETRRTFPGLSQHLGRLTASQYLAEVVLLMALSDCPQDALFQVLVEHLGRLETTAPGALLAALCHGLYHLLALAGVAPEVHQCTLSRVAIVPNLLDPAWRPTPAMPWSPKPPVAMAKEPSDRGCSPPPMSPCYSSSVSPRFSRLCPWACPRACGTMPLG